MLVALTRERGRNEELRTLIGRRADIVELPLTVTNFRLVSDVEDELRSLRHFGQFRSLVVTSARCGRYVALVRGALVEVPEVFSVGSATSLALHGSGLAVTRESAGTALDLAPFITEGPVLILGAHGGRAELRETLERSSLEPRVVACYSTLNVTLDDAQRQKLRSAHVVFIGAPSAWRSARGVVDHDAWVLVPGPTTLEAVKEDHQRVMLGWGEDFAIAWSKIVSAGA